MSKELQLQQSVLYKKTKEKIKGIVKIPFKFFQILLLRIRKPFEDINPILKIIKEGRCLSWPDELMQVYQCAKSATHLEGSMAEMGVAGGATAKAICMAKGNKKLFLFDTFEGLPPPDKIDKQFYEGQCYFSLESVRAYLAHYNNIFFVKGKFPNTANVVKEEKFAFVHLDCDLCQSTKDSLCFFYDKMVRGGIILSHDYSNTLGVKKAFDEFFGKKPERIIELSTSQCMIVKQ